MPAITFVLCVTKTLTILGLPSCCPRYRNVVPGWSGRNLLSMRLTKAAGAGRAGIGVARLAPGNDAPGEALTTSMTARATAARRPIATPVRWVMFRTLVAARETWWRASRTDLT